MIAVKYAFDIFLICDYIEIITIKKGALLKNNAHKVISNQRKEKESHRQ